MSPRSAGFTNVVAMIYFSIEYGYDHEFTTIVIAPEGTTEEQARQTFLDRHSYHPIEQGRFHAVLIDQSDIITIEEAH